MQAHIKSFDEEQPIHLGLVEQLSNAKVYSMYSQYAMPYTAWIARIRRDVASYFGLQVYGGLPKLVHMDDVAIQLSVWGFNTESWLAAGYFHDLLEDCVSENPATPEYALRISNLQDIILYWGGQGALDLVMAVTNDPRKNRKEQIAQLVTTLQQLPVACYLKIADRLCNVRAVLWEMCFGDQPNLAKWAYLQKLYLEEDVLLAPVFGASVRTDIYNEYGIYLKMLEKAYTLRAAGRTSNDMYMRHPHHRGFRTPLSIKA